MQNNELETIAAAMQEALHRAYALGRSDALRRVVEMVQSDELGSKTVALLSHSEPSHPEAAPLEIEASASGSETHYAETADADPAHSSNGRHESPHNDNSESAISAQDAPKPPASVKDFLLDYLYPLGAKK